MRAILIDPKSRTVTEVDVKEGDAFNDHAHELMGCRCFTCCTAIALNGEEGDSQDDMMLADDEGLLNNPEHFFLIKAYGRPVAGKCLIVGMDEHGETVAAKIAIDAFEVLWMNRNDIRLYAENEQATVDRLRADPNYNHCIVISMKEALE